MSSSRYFLSSLLCFFLASITHSVEAAPGAPGATSASTVKQTNLDSIVMHLSQAKIYFSLKKSAEALQELKQGLKISPNDVRLLQTKGLVDLYDCRYLEAIDDYTRVIARLPKDVDSYLSRADACLRIGRYELARKDIETAIKFTKPDYYGRRLLEVKNLEFDSAHRTSDPARRWALACTALLFVLNGEGLESLAGQIPAKAPGTRALLESWWHVTDRASLLRCLESLVSDGHNKLWLGINRVKNFSPLLLSFKSAWDDQEDYESALGLVRRYGDEYGERGLLAWDSCRYICLCRWGYQAGYLSEADAWELMMPMAAKIQGNCKSWNQLANEYLVGREFWSHSYYTKGIGTDSGIRNRLSRDANSPWVKLPWNTPLQCKGDNQTISAVIRSVSSR